MSDFVKENSVALFTISTCDSCNNLKKLLQEKEIEFKAVDVDKSTMSFTTATAFELGTS